MEKVVVLHFVRKIKEKGGEEEQRPLCKGSIALLEKMSELCGGIYRVSA